MPENLTDLTFGYNFNQKIEQNTLPENLMTITFGYCFNQKLEPDILPHNLFNINFNWLYLSKNDFSSHIIEIINNIPSYYDVKIFSDNDIFNIDRFKFPIHVADYQEKKWPLFQKYSFSFFHWNHIFHQKKPFFNMMYFIEFFFTKRI